MQRQILGLKAYLFGHYSEKLALSYLKTKKHKIIKTNYHTKYGEIDIITMKNNIIHFIEVKSSEKSYEPHYYLNNQKYNKIIKSIDVFFIQNQNYINTSYSVDLLCVSKENNDFTYDLIENISFS